MDAKSLVKEMIKDNPNPTIGMTRNWLARRFGRRPSKEEVDDVFCTLIYDRIPEGSK